MIVVNTHVDDVVVDVSQDLIDVDVVNVLNVLKMKVGKIFNDKIKILNNANIWYSLFQHNQAEEDRIISIHLVNRTKVGNQPILLRIVNSHQVIKILQSFLSFNFLFFIPFPNGLSGKEKPKLIEKTLFNTFYLIYLLPFGAF